MQILPLDPKLIENQWGDIEKIELNSNLAPVWEIDNFMTDLPKKWLLSRVIVINNSIKGYAILSEKSTECAHLHRLVLATQEQKKGIGSSVLEFLITNLSPYYKFLTLKVKSEAAKKFYLKMDFSPLSFDGQYTLMLRVLK